MSARVKSTGLASRGHLTGASQVSLNNFLLEQFLLANCGRPLWRFLICPNMSSQQAPACHWWRLRKHQAPQIAFLHYNSNPLGIWLILWRWDRCSLCVCKSDSCLNANNIVTWHQTFLSPFNPCFTLKVTFCWGTFHIENHAKCKIN